jgi:hypothetical protein
MRIELRGLAHRTSPEAVAGCFYQTPAMLLD